MRKFLAISVAFHVAAALLFSFGGIPRGEERVALEMQTLTDVPRAPIPGVKAIRDAKPVTKKDAVPVAEQGAGKKAGINPGAGSDVPYYRIEPEYPKSALINGTTGHVDFKIDINEAGEVENIRVIGGENVDTFAHSARRALSKWKYKPFVDSNGKPVRKVDHFVTIDFTFKES